MAIDFLYLSEADMIKAGVLNAKGCVETMRDVMSLFGKGDYMELRDTEIFAFGKKIPVKWTLTLAKVNSIRNLAEINFETKFGVSDDRFFSRLISYKGKIIFNMAEGVIHQADWSSEYKAKQICKEMAIQRNLWSFEKKTNYSLRMTGVEK